MRAGANDSLNGGRGKKTKKAETMKKFAEKLSFVLSKRAKGVNGHRGVRGGGGRAKNLEKRRHPPPPAGRRERGWKTMRGVAGRWPKRQRGRGITQ